MQDFPSTRPSAILATASDDPLVRRDAWERIVSAYWKPVYKYLRLRWRQTPEAAEELTQAFFTFAMEKEFLARFDAERASFRTYLRTCLDAFVANEFKAAGRQKRGGGATMLSLDFASAEFEAGRQEWREDMSPEEYFHREWQRQVFALAVEDLRDWAERQGKAAALRCFEMYDLAEERRTYDEIGAAVGVPATTVTNHLHAMRRQLRVLVARRIDALTVTEQESRQEAQRLLGGGGATS
ncbi:MAG: sigma-70 family RNA polymerase sigma factor [Bryobacteraceae bacterium]|nr:sigma-70 family RNA polymerase sigma factor [Bryobacteraceae bacterium]